MTGKERMLTALRRETPDCVPTFEWFIDEAVGQALTGEADPIAIVEALDLDGINIRPDYTRQAAAAGEFSDEWGIRRRLTGDCLPCVVDSPLKDLSSHAAYAFPDPAAPQRFRTLERALERFGDRRAVVLNLRDGFSDMRDLLGYEEALVQLILEPALFSQFLSRVVDYNLALAEAAVKRYGISIIATTDDIANASGLLIPHATYAEVIGPSFRRVVQGYRELGCHVIKHCDGDVRPLVDFWIDCGIACLDPIDPGAGLRLDTMKQQYGDRICLKGNVNCAGALQYGSEADVEAEVLDCLSQAGRSGYILSSSNTIHRGVKPENYRAMLRALRREGGR